MQFQYNVNRVQLMMLQINSRSAQQKVTVQCQNTGVMPSFEGFKHDDLFTTDNKDDGSSMVELDTLQNGCSVIYNA